MAVQNAMFVACAAHVFEVSGYLRCSEKMNFQFLHGLQLIAYSLYRLGCTYRHINNYTEQWASWEATISLALPDNQNVLWNSNFCFQVHVPILRQTVSNHNLLFFFFQDPFAIYCGIYRAAFSLRLPTKISMFYWIYMSSLPTLVLFFLYDLPKILASTTLSIIFLYFFAMNIKVTEIICFQIQTEHYLCSGKYWNIN